jgi:ribosomal protein L34
MSQGPTFRPRSKRRRLRVHGFMARMRRSLRVIKLRRLKGRARLTVS